MMGREREDGAGYARLPEDLLADLLGSVPRMSQRVEQLLGPAVELRGELREQAQRLKRIQQLDGGSTRSVCGVDGGYAVERTLAVDLVLSVAVGVEGFGPSGTASAWAAQQFAYFSEVLRHDSENDRLARSSMVAQELDVLAMAPHDYRILDGSHLTPVIQLNSGFSSQSDDVRVILAELCRKRATAAALSEMSTSPNVVAMPKYDSSRELARTLGAHLGRQVPSDDKHLTSLLLQGGEYTTPQQVPEQWQELHITARQGSPTIIVEAARDLDDAIHGLRERAIDYTYFKPDDRSPAYRLEFKPALIDDRDGLQPLLATIASQITGPFVREPYPQYLADVMAKSVGLGLTALQTAAQLTISRGGRPDLAWFLLHSYRTEGIG